MAKLTSMVKAEELAAAARSTGKYHYIGVYKSMPPENLIYFSVQRKAGGEWERITDDQAL